MKLPLRSTCAALVFGFATCRAADPNAFFPLMAWNHVPSDAATFQKMRECGLTVAGFVSPRELDLCHAAGLRAIVSDPRASRYDWRNVDEAQARNFGDVPAECHGPREDSLVKAISGSGFLAGDFTHTDGARYVMIVNKDFVRSQHCAPQFRQAPKQVRMVSPYTGVLTGFSGEQMWLAAGQGVLLRLE